MKKGVLFSLAAIAVGAVIVGLGGKKTKPTLRSGHPFYKGN